MLRHVKYRWPEEDVPPGELVWFFEEIDDAADAVTRSVWMYLDGSITRNSIEIEERNGKLCPRLSIVPWPRASRTRTLNC